MHSKLGKLNSNVYQNKSLYSVVTVCTGNAYNLPLKALIFLERSNNLHDCVFVLFCLKIVQSTTGLTAHTNRAVVVLDDDMRTVLV